jgi:sulfhydrogenase subunit delta
MSNSTLPRLAIFKFASCDGCQLTLLDCEDQLLAIAEVVEIAYFLEARRRALPGPYDLTLVEGSVTTEEEIERIRAVRAKSRFLVSIGACATAGGIQALRNWAEVSEYTRLVYANPAYISTLETSRPISDYVKVDFELRGCPINKSQLLELITSILIGRKPKLPSHSVCLECKRRGVICLPVARGEPCLGPVTQAGCGAICPAYQRGCYGCFGPVESGNPRAVGEMLLDQGMTRTEVVRALRSFNGYAKGFRELSESYESGVDNG